MALDLAVCALTAEEARELASPGRGRVGRTAHPQAGRASGERPPACPDGRLEGLTDAHTPGIRLPTFKPRFLAPAAEATRAAHIDLLPRRNQPHRLRAKSDQKLIELVNS